MLRFAVASAFVLASTSLALAQRMPVDYAAGGLGSLIVFALLIAAIALSLLPLFAVDWKNNAIVGWCIVMLMVFGGVIAVEGPPVLRDLSLLVMWGLATIAAAITRLGATMSRMLAIQASVAKHDPVTAKPIVMTSAEALSTPTEELERRSRAR